MQGFAIIIDPFIKYYDRIFLYVVKTNFSR